jgi:hypothetical protein
MDPRRISSPTHLVTIAAIGHRREVYRDLNL